MYLSPTKLKILSRVIKTLAEPYEEAQVRELVGHQLLELLDADYYASYVWNDAEMRFGTRVALHMDDTNLGRYENYYQFQDPITPIMQKMRCPVLMEEVMLQSELIRTECFNDFLALDGLYWGVNLFAWQGTVNLGDMRIWRHRQRERFDRETLDILELLKPAFTAALSRARHNGLFVESATDESLEMDFDLLGALSDCRSNLC
ncbi:MAG: helix-turn-helix transcriptional regulator [Limnohabitans sp.]|nr:helix-turn-helix transcriptional regulator [Limnohabitans sp.]